MTQHEQQHIMNLLSTYAQHTEQHMTDLHHQSTPTATWKQQHMAISTLGTDKHVAITHLHVRLVY